MMKPTEEEAFARRLAELALTDAMSIKELSRYFDCGWRKMKLILDHMEGVEQYGTSYRVPLCKMPFRYLKENNLWAVYCGIVPNPAGDTDSN